MQIAVCMLDNKKLLFVDFDVSKIFKNIKKHIIG